MTILPPSPAPRNAERARAMADARRSELLRRARRIRRSVAALATSLFVAAFLVVYVQLASGHDPALIANEARRAKANDTALVSAKAKTTTASRAKAKAKASTSAASSDARSTESASTSSGTTGSTSASAGSSSSTSGETSSAKSSESSSGETGSSTSSLTTSQS